MARATVRVRGLKEFQRALAKTSPGDLRKGLNREIRQAGQVVADDARARFSGISPRSAAGFRPRTKGYGRAVVEQRLRRTTGKRGDYGALQMRRALLPALGAKRNEVLRNLEEMLDRLLRGNF